MGGVATDMERRSLLATGASLAAAAATAGCLGRTGAGDGGGDDSTTDSSTTDHATDEAGSDDGDASFDDDADPGVPDCADLYDDHESVAAVVCAGESASRQVSFGQNTDRLARGETLETTLVNDGAAAAVGLNPYAWSVHRRVGGGDWKRLERGAYVEPWVTLASGERLRWRVGVGEVEVQPHADDRVYGGSLDLDAGTYAFSAIVDVDGQRVAFVAPFAVAE